MPYAPLFQFEDSHPPTSDLSSKQALTKANNKEKLWFLLNGTRSTDRCIEALLKEDSSLCLLENMARAGVYWELPNLEELLRDKNTAIPSLLVSSELPKTKITKLIAETQQSRSVEQIILTLGHRETEAIDFYPIAKEYRRGGDDSDIDPQVIDRTLALLDWSTYQADLLAGEAGAEWLKEPLFVGDFLQSSPKTSWSKTLAFVEDKGEPIRWLSGAIATTTAGALRAFQPDQSSIGQLQDFLINHWQADGDEPESWEGDAVSAGLSSAIAVSGEDSQLGLFLAQATAHELLLASQAASPGIPGLPFSSNLEEQVDTEEAVEFIEGLDGSELTPFEVIAGVYTLVELAEYARSNPRSVRDLDVDLKNDSLCRACRYLRANKHFANSDQSSSAQSIPPLMKAFGLEGNRPDELVNWVLDNTSPSSVKRMCCMESLLEYGTEKQIQRFGDIWSECSIQRGEFFRILADLYLQ